MTTADLVAIRKALAQATQGPWRACGNERGGCPCGLVKSLPADDTVASCFDHTPDGRFGLEKQKANARLIANAPTWLEQLCDEVERLREASDRSEP